MSSHSRPLSLLIILAAIFTLFAIPTPVSADTFSVNTEDDLDDGQCDSNHCSLREAINAANANIGPDLIEFSSLNATSQEVTIELMSLLPPLLDNGTTIDGTTVGGYAGVPRILIVKGVPTLEEGINIQGSNCTIRGLSMAGFGLPTSQQYPPIYDYHGGAIVLSGGNNLIENNVLGWGAWPNTVGLRMASSGNTAVGNVIGGNGIGIYILNHSQIIRGNMVGVDASGTTSVPNAYGIYDDVNSGGDHQIGGPNSLQRNVISGNTFIGLTIASADSIVENNFIGTDISGTAAVGNETGIALYEAHNNLIVNNLISGNSLYGLLTLQDVSGSSLIGNNIGSDISGTSPLPNQTGAGLFGSGILIGGGSNDGNLIFGNSHAGIWISSAAFSHNIINNTITQNGGAFNDAGVAMNTVSLPGQHVSRNSIFDNAGLGIEDNGSNPMPPPVITSTSGNAVYGTTCSNCEAEIFLADPDPSGAGEGMQFLVTAVADSNGDFQETVSIVGYCQPITATALQASPGWTSEFSQNVLINCFVLEPPFLIPIWTFIITVFGVLGILLRRRNPARPPALVPGGFAVGILVAAGLTFFGNRLPAVQIQWTSEETVPFQGELPSCKEYLDPAGFAPADGSLVESYEDIMLEWSPIGDLPDGEIRWLVGVEDFVSQSANQATAENSLPLASFGLKPMINQAYGWTVLGQVSVDGGNTWMPFCNRLSPMTFEFSQVVEEEIVQEEPEACEAELVATMNLTCRSGPDAVYEELGYLLEGETAIPEGISPDGFWYWILNPDWNGHCFVWSGGLEAFCVGDLEIITVPEPSPTPPVCVSTLDRDACEAVGGTYFIGAASASCICPEE